MDEQYPCQGRFLRVRLEPTGAEGDERYWEVVERPAAVGMVAVTANSEVILVRQYRPPVGVSTLEIPAGLVDPGEAPEACARRELLEETGYAAQAIQPVASLLVSPGFTDERLELMLALHCEKVPDFTGLDTRTSVQLIPHDELDGFLASASDAPMDAKTFSGLLWLRLNLENLGLR